MIALRAGDASAVILPEAGAAFARLALRGRDLLVPVAPGADPNAGFHGAFVMAPWTNRLDAGRITAAGREYRMPVNRAAENTALHGFVREQAWRVERADASRLLLSCRVDRAPFAGSAQLLAQLAEDRLELRIRLTNAALVPVPMGIGWHPYFPRPPGTRLRAAARIVFGRDARNLPIGPRPTTGILGGDAVLEGLDTHFAGWDGRAAIDWPDGNGLTLHASGDWAGNLQIFAPAQGTIIAVEPVSHAPDAPNRPAAAAHGAMHPLMPGATREGSLTIHWR